MSRLNKYLNKESPRSTSITKEEAVELMHTKCKKAAYAYKKGICRLYRGLNKSFPYMISDPSKSFRSSAGSHNYIYLLMDYIFKAYKDIPKRTRSIIGTTNEHSTKQYGDLYIMLPYNEAKIAYVDKNDFWNAFVFKYDKSHIDEINDDLYNLSIMDNIKLNDKDPKKLVKDLLKLEKKLRELEGEDKEEFTVRKRNLLYVSKYIQKVIEGSDENMVEMLERIYDPVGVIKITYPGKAIKAVGDYAEIWTDSKVLLLDKRLGDNLI